MDNFLGNIIFAFTGVLIGMMLSFFVIVMRDDVSNIENGKIIKIDERKVISDKDFEIYTDQENGVLCYRHRNSNTVSCVPEYSTLKKTKGIK